LPVENFGFNEYGSKSLTVFCANTQFNKNFRRFNGWVEPTYPPPHSNGPTFNPSMFAQVYA